MKFIKLKALIINQNLKSGYFSILFFLKDPSCTSIGNGCFIAEQSCER